MNIWKVLPSQRKTLLIVSANNSPLSETVQNLCKFLKPTNLVVVSKKISSEKQKIEDICAERSCDSCIHLFQNKKEVIFIGLFRLFERKVFDFIKLEVSIPSEIKLELSDKNLNSRLANSVPTFSFASKEKELSAEAALFAAIFTDLFRVSFEFNQKCLFSKFISCIFSNSKQLEVTVSVFAADFVHSKLDSVLSQSLQLKVVDFTKVRDKELDTEAFKHYKVNIENSKKKDKRLIEDEIRGKLGKFNVEKQNIREMKHNNLLRGAKVLEIKRRKKRKNNK